MFDVYKVRKDFPMFRNNIQMQNHPLVFLDNASTTFKPDCVLQAITDYYSKYTSNSHRGDYDFSFIMDTKVEETRKLVANFINAQPNECVFTSGDTSSLNMIVLGYTRKFLTKGDEIILSVAEHASNLLPWFKLCEEIGTVIKYVELDKEGRITVENVKKALTEKTKIISLAHVGNVLGYIADIKSISKVAHENGAIMVCDGAQSVPHLKTDVKDLDVDFLTFSAHKMCGPTGVGILYGKAELLDKMDAAFVGGGMNGKFYKDGRIVYLPAPQKFEAGTLNIEGILGFGAAIEYINSLGIDSIRIYEENLRKYAMNRLSKVDSIEVYNPNAEAGIITFNKKGVFGQDYATWLNSKGIACRSGQHCAKILDDFLPEKATVRMSFYFYTTKEEIDNFIDRLIEEGDFLDAYFA